MQVLVVTGSLYNPVGGPYHSVRASILAMHKKGMNVTVIGTRDSKNQSERAEEYIEPVPGISVQALRKFGPYNVHFSFNLLAYWRGVKRADFISIQGVWMLNCLITALFAIMQGKPYYFAIRGEFNDPESLAALDKRLIGFWVRYVFNKSSYLQVLNEREIASLRAYGYEGRIEVIPNGIEVSEAIPSIENKEKIILYLGRIHPQKGIALLIEAWRSANTDNWKLVIAGDGEPEHKKVLLGSIDESESIDYIGPIRGIEKTELIRKASWFILPSFMEGMPMAVLEALSLGTPVLITEECNLHQVFEEDAGIHINTDALDIMNKLNTAIQMNKKDYAAKVSNGLELVTTKFQWDNVIDQIVQRIRISLK